MDPRDVNAITRTLISLPTRRNVVRGLAGAGLGLGGLRLADAVEAKNKKAKKGRKRKGKKRNQDQNQNQNQNQDQTPPVVTPSPPPPPVDTPPSPPPPPTRGLVTRTFTSTQPITIVDDALARPYPATIEVSGFSNGTITDVNLTLRDFSHTAPADLDVLLEPRQLPNQNAIVMNGVGSTYDVTGITLTLDDQAAAPLPGNGPLISGTFQTNNFAGSSDFPGQTPSGNSSLSIFNGGNPNGSWQLFVVDGAPGDTGLIAGGWSLQITAEVDLA